MRDELEYEIDLLQGLLCDAELRQYYLEYINNVAPLLDHTFSSNFNSPRTPPQHLARYFPPPILQLANILKIRYVCFCCSCLWLFGASKSTYFHCPLLCRCLISLLLQECEYSLINTTFEDFSVDSVTAFFILSIYYTCTDSVLHSHYSITAGKSRFYLKYFD